MIRKPRWHTRAACLGVGTHVFYPDMVGVGERKAYQDARDYCKKCPVQRECLEQAMEDEITSPRRYGMFGGLTPKERRELQLKRDTTVSRSVQRVGVRPSVEREGLMQQALLESLPDPELGEI